MKDCGKSVHTPPLPTFQVLPLRFNVRARYENSVSSLRFSFRDSVVGIVTRLRAERSELRIPVGARDVPTVQNVQTGPGANPGSYSMGTGVLSKR